MQSSATHMKNKCIILILGMVPILLLSGCLSRTILHGHQRPATVSKKTTIWFVKPSGEGLQLVSVVRPVYGDRFEYAIKELLSGPTEQESKQGLGSEIPRGTILLGITRKGEKNIELNLSRRFASNGGTTSFETRMMQLSKTAGEAAGKADVYLSVEGQRLNISEGEGIEIHQPINR
jgi:spore germination protein GerM